ncbi:DUF4230 domain-containing protein [Silvibacterium sp.]|uniref:DUF4230 domain-containing protein n=1 Tax=Silvibacterium sp. TaxID=1964179 RepID=UPI0039E6CFBF
MAIETSSATERRTGRGTGPGTVLLAIFLGLLLGVGALALFVREATYGIWNQVATKVTGRALSIDTSQPTVVDRIQKLSRLETVTYTMDKTVEGDRTNAILPDFLVGDKLLLNVHGQAIAGVDLGQLKPWDVQVNGKTAHVHLPPAQIFVTALDDSKTRVFSRATGFFVQADPNLESEVREKAQEQLTASAQQAGILGTARANAASTVTKLLLSLGFDQVTVD